MILQPDLAIPLLLSVVVYLDGSRCNILGSAVTTTSAAMSIALLLPLLSLLFLRFGVFELEFWSGLLDPSGLVGGDVTLPQGVVRTANIRQHGKSYLW